MGSETARLGYLANVVPRSISVGVVFGRPESEAHLSKIHTFIRVGDTVYEVDTPTKEAPDSGQVRKYSAEEYYQKLLTRSDKPIRGELLFSFVAFHAAPVQLLLRPIPQARRQKMEIVQTKP